MPLSIHDNFVLGYSVQSEERTLVIRTEYRDGGEPFEQTNVLFSGLLAYQLRDCLDGILFDIDVDDIDSILTDYAEVFEWGRKYGWPGTWFDGPAAPKEVLRELGAKVWRIQGQTAFDGFVVAEAMVLKPAR